MKTELNRAELSVGALQAGASISCRVNFNLQLFCDRRFCQHASQKLLFFSSLLLLLDTFFNFALLAFVIYMTFGLFGQFGLLVQWYIRGQAICCRAHAPIPFAISFNVRKGRERWRGQKQHKRRRWANCRCRQTPNYASLAPAENSISQIRRR